MVVAAPQLDELDEYTAKRILAAVLSQAIRDASAALPRQRRAEARKIQREARAFLATLNEPLRSRALAAVTRIEGRLSPWSRTRKGT